MVRMFCDCCGKEIIGRYYKVKLFACSTEDRYKDVAAQNAMCSSYLAERVIPDIVGYCPDCAQPAVKLVLGDEEGEAGAGR